MVLTRSNFHILFQLLLHEQKNQCLQNVILYNGEMEVNFTGKKRQPEIY